MKEKVAVLSTARSEYYQLRGLLRRLASHPLFELQLIVSGAHLSARYGRSEQDISEDGFPVAARLPILVDEDSGVGAAMTAGLAVSQVGQALRRLGSDLLVVAGDRYETLAAGVAATCVGVPIAHLHGGEKTEGALDDACRHALTKLSALHFVSTEPYRLRVLQMGELPERVITSGAPFLDEVLATPLHDEKELTHRLGRALESPVALVAYHPATRESTHPATVCQHLLDSVSSCASIVLTAPNSDPGREDVLATMERFTEANPRARLYANLGSRGFLSVMARATLMVGNSSSGIHESATFQLPVVNVGNRQEGRLRPRNVIDCSPEPESIRGAVARALSPEFRASLAGLVNPYGTGRAADMIVSSLERFVPFKSLLLKSFQDSPEVRAASQHWSETC